MASITSREQLKEYCLRRLGAPVIEINVDDAQVEDRIDDAVQFLAEYHFDGVEKVFLTHTITQQEYNQKFITLSNPNILSIIRVYADDGLGGSDILSARAQYTLQDFSGMIDADLTTWTINQQRLTLIQQMLDPEKSIRWNRITNILHIDTDWETELPVGEDIMFEVYSQVNPADYPDIYDTMFLKRYSTALVKMQWGQNLSKYDGIQLPGGVTFNGKALYDEAKADAEKLEAEMRLSFELPPDFIVG